MHIHVTISGLRHNALTISQSGQGFQFLYENPKNDTHERYYAIQKFLADNSFEWHCTIKECTVK